MISLPGQGLFLLCAMFAVLSAIGTVVMHNPIRAAMSLLAHIVSLSGLFLILHAQLLAALQILVYAGAVVVLFVFVIMMIGPSVDEPAVMRGMIIKTISVAVMLVLTAILAFSLMPVTMPNGLITACADGVTECDQFGGVGAFSAALFTGGLVPFELISVLLTVAIVGAIAVARGRTAEEAQALNTKLEAQAKLAAETLAREQKMSAEVSAHGGH